MPATETASETPADKGKSNDTLRTAVILVGIAVVCFFLWPLFLGLGFGFLGGILSLIFGLVGTILTLVAVVLGLIFSLLGTLVILLPVVGAGILAWFVAMAIIKLLRK